MESIETQGPGLRQGSIRVSIANSWRMRSQDLGFADLAVTGSVEFGGLHIGAQLAKLLQQVKL